jgi:hypothetical protein
MEQEIISQYRASLKMLIDVIDKCPETLWNNAAFENPYWRIVYHTLFYTALYLSEATDTFVPWEKHILNYNYLGKVTQHNSPIVIERIYNKDETISYAESIYKDCENSVINMKGKESGFEWLPMNRLEIHIYNIRHLQHHIGQLTERLHQSGIRGINWETMSKPG